MGHSIVDEYLPKEEFDKLSSFLMGPYFPLFATSPVARTEINEVTTRMNYYFTHNFLLNGNESDYFRPIYDEHFNLRFGSINLIRMKLNAFPSTEKVYEHLEHVDYYYPHQGALLCLNTCDGYTKIGDDIKVPSVANRMIFFDTSKPHKSTTCSDQMLRYNLVWNYTT